MSAVVDVDDDELAGVAGSDSGRVLPLGVSERQVARVRSWMARKTQLAREGKPMPTKPCVTCGFATDPLELFCRSCWQRRKRRPS